jgi:hypothetical protein
MRGINALATESDLRDTMNRLRLLDRLKSAFGCIWQQSGLRFRAGCDSISGQALSDQDRAVLAEDPGI